MKLYIVILLTLCIPQDIFTEYLCAIGDSVVDCNVENSVEIDVFSYQIPENYDATSIHPLLITFHQWGGNENSNYSTQFDEEANERNWIMLSPYGGSANNYNHQGAQAMVENEIIWMMNSYNIDSTRIYMVGGSMGGAAGSIYANNHIDPTKPMVAATASASGILDCERRAIEMDGNNSMIEWFGGNWDEVPFEYHRNSAVYFADSTQSMHYNLKYTPLYLDFGETETHRTHAEDLYNLLLGYNENMWIDTIPTGNHGYPVFNENHVCDWLNQFDLNLFEEQNYHLININLDEPSRAYWLETNQQLINDNFIRINAEWEQIDGDDFELIKINQIENSDSLILHVLNENIEYFTINLNIPINLGFTGDIINSQSIINSLMIYGLPEECFYNYIIDNNIIWIHSIDPWGNSCYENYSLFPGDYGLTFFISSSEIYDDINQDGIWDILDVILVINHILGIDILYGYQFENADLNNDQIINILDIIEIINIILTN